MRERPLRLGHTIRLDCGVYSLHSAKGASLCCPWGWVDLIMSHRCLRREPFIRVSRRCGRTILDSIVHMRPSAWQVICGQTTARKIFPREEELCRTVTIASNETFHGTLLFLFR